MKCSYQEILLDLGEKETDLFAIIIKVVKKMSKNNYIAKQRATQQGFFVAGLQTGRQQIIDMLSLALRDSEIMGKDMFGKERLLKVINGIGEYMDVFQKAWERDDETDYYRAKLDDCLACAYGEELHDSFLKRYEFFPEYDYSKGKWK